MSAIAIRFHDDPSALVTLCQAFLSSRSRGAPAAPEIRVTRLDYLPCQRHLDAFDEICQLEPTPQLHLLYPLALAYPYLMRILCRREMPFSMFSVLNVRDTIVAHRPISRRERLDICCRTSALRAVAKGIEIDLQVDVKSHKELVWQCTVCYLARGVGGAELERVDPPKIDPLGEPDFSCSWFLPARDRLRFARVSGDTNGIHYGAWYARLHGFRRDFAQPIRVVSRCVDALPPLSDRWPRRLELFLKGPVYYESELTLRSRTVGDGRRFDLFCEGDERPCISGCYGLSKVVPEHDPVARLARAEVLEGVVDL